MNTVIDTHAPDSTSPHAAFDDGLAAFITIRPRLFGIAYRMLGCAAAAEDVVQDVWLRWHTTDRRLVRDAGAFLVTATTRLAINVVQSARVRRTVDSGDSLPEAVDTAADQRSLAERRQALRSAFQLLTERLTPTERAAFILREAFDYPYREIGRVLRLQAANARQVVTRARQHLAEGRGAGGAATAPSQLLDALVAAIDAGDLAGLEARCAAEVRGDIQPRCTMPAAAA